MLNRLRLKPTVSERTYHTTLICGLTHLTQTHTQGSTQKKSAFKDKIEMFN